MKPAPFGYVRAVSIEQATAELADAESEDIKVVAGGQSLLPLLAMRLATPVRLVDVNALHDLDAVLLDDSEVVLGALVRHRRLVMDAEVAAALPLLSVAARHIGHAAIRNRGTLGGSLAHSDPAAELCAIALLLDGRVVCVSAGGGWREVSASKFFAGPYMTTLAPDELLVSVRLPRKGPHVRHGFVEYAVRAGDYARCGVVCQLMTNPDGSVGGVRAVVFGSGFTPVLLTREQGEPVGADPAAVDWAEVAGAWADELSNNGISAARQTLATTALRRALTGAVHSPEVP